MIKAILFDFDGTLTSPGALDFPVFKDELGCPRDKPVWEFIQDLEDKERQTKAYQRLDAFELAAAAQAQPNDHAEELITLLKSRKYRLGVISRNSINAIHRALANFTSLSITDFDVVITRDSPVAMKPEPDGILYAGKQLQVPTNQIMVIGDYCFDMEAGRRAGAVTVFLKNRSNALPEDSCDYQIDRLTDIEPVLELLAPLPLGKLPNELLFRILSTLETDESVLIKPNVGEDTTAVSVSGQDALVMTMDPITFATDSIGYYTVLVNANDLATSGAIPRWLLTTLLLPPETTAHHAFAIIKEIRNMCRSMSINLCGGHTEITDAVTRPVIIGTLAGTVSKQELQDKEAVRPGDRVLVTKSIAVEGTALIAREFPGRLADMGFSEGFIAHCQSFLADISILHEARLACAIKCTTALHDITEGGIATALTELCQSCGYGLHINLEAIPVFPETARICQALGLDPLGLIGSGSLLICCQEQGVKELIASLTANHIPVCNIGCVVSSGTGITASRNGRAAEWPCFQRDELARLF